MIDHVSLRVSDFEKSKIFYQLALAPIGYRLISEFPEWKVGGLGSTRPDLWLKEDAKVTPTHIALIAENKEAVDAFYTAGLKAGGSDNGAPGYRTEYSPGYYAAFIHDPDGHNIEVVFHDPEVKV